MSRAALEVERTFDLPAADLALPDLTGCTGVAEVRALLKLPAAGRKAAKQARYAGEAVEPFVGAAAARSARRVEGVQEVLGELQDSVVSRAALRELGVVAHLAGENGFTFGLLHGRELLRARHAEQSWERAWDRLDRRSVLRWLR